jgi:PAS domain S-box-containing protein
MTGVNKKSGSAQRSTGDNSGLAHFLLPPSLSWMLFVYAAVALAAGWTYSALQIRYDREQTLNAERIRLRSVSTAIGTGILAMINDGVGAAVAAAGETDTGSVTPAALSRLLSGDPYVRALFLATPTRFVRAGRSNAGEVSDHAPAWLTALQTSSGIDDTWAGSPIPDPERSEHRVIPVARRATTPDGHAIWAGALLDFYEFDLLHTRVAGDASIMGLVASDGTVLMLIPRGGRPGKGPAVGTNISANPLFKESLRQPGTGVVEGYSPSYAAQMLFAYDRVNGFPVSVVAGEPLEAVLSRWFGRRNTTLIVATGASVLIIIMTGLLSYYLRALRGREAHYRSLFNNATFSVMLLEGGRFVDTNHTAVRMFGLKSEKQAIGLTPWELSPERQADGTRSEEAARARIQEALRQGATSFEWLHRRMDDNATFPAQVDLSSLSTGSTTLALAVVHDLTSRKGAEQKLRESEGRYRALVDALPEAVFVHREDRVLFANDAALRLIGARSVDDLSGLSILSFASEPDREAITVRTRRILEEGARTDPRETQIRKLDGTIIWVDIQGVRIDYEGTPAVQVVMHDVTARKLRREADEARTERVQRQSDALLKLASHNQAERTDLWTILRGICESSAETLVMDRVCIWLFEDDARTLRCAADCGRRAGRRREGTAIATNRLPQFLAVVRTERVIHADEMESDSRLQELVQVGMIWPGAKSLIAAAVRSSGELTGIVLFESCDEVRKWQIDEVSFAGGVADQISQGLLDSQREQVLRDLRALAAELMRIQDEERRRIGRDLHDSTGQTLAALEMDLARLMSGADALPPRDRDLLQECAKLASQCSAEIRTASYLLHPPLLDELGLVSALRWLADGLRQRGGIEVRLELPDSIPRLRPEEELTLFRIAQEALTNAHRHSASPWVEIRLTAGSDSVQLDIEDAGRGVPDVRGEDRIQLGVGLAGMRERIRQVGGTFAVHSTPSGTCIVATLPVRSSAGSGSPAAAQRSA